jgi:predicted ArsR family transcriptional regulator
MWQGPDQGDVHVGNSDWLERHKQKSDARRSRIIGYLSDRADASGVEIFQALKINTSYLYRDLEFLERSGDLVSYEKDVSDDEGTEVMRVFYRLVRGESDAGYSGEEE